MNDYFIFTKSIGTTREPRFEVEFHLPLLSTLDGSVQVKFSQLEVNSDAVLRVQMKDQFKLLKPRKQSDLDLFINNWTRTLPIAEKIWKEEEEARKKKAANNPKKGSTSENGIAHRHLLSSQKKN